MAQIIEIPVSFDFRTVKVEWYDVAGRIVGWSGDNEFALEVELKDRRKQRIRYSGDELPDELRHQCLNALTDDYGSGSENDESTEKICADFRPQLFVPWGQGFLDEELAGRSQPANAWQLREAFLRVTPEPKHILEFLRQWGRWEADNYMRLRDFVDLQSIVREALVSAPEKWFESGYDNLDLAWDRRREFPYFAVETFDCEPAIRMTVTIDLLRQVKFRICARADCSQPFSIASAHKRRYCTQYCGHLVSLRRSRKKNKAARARAARASA